jgi:hypothetical protein
MKKGLVSPDQPVFSKITWPLRVEIGPELGPYIAEVVDSGNEFLVNLPFYWVDVPDEATRYSCYYNTVTSTVEEITSSIYYLTENITGYGSVGEAVKVIPASGPQPENTTPVPPPQKPSSTEQN